MPKLAAGILLYRRSPRGLEVLLAHPGGPLWARKDLGAWTIPKGQFGSDESALEAAQQIDNSVITGLFEGHAR